MKRALLGDMVGGWFVGDFNPAAFHTKDFEVAVKSYEAGSYDELHYHKLAMEITVLISGKAEMAGEVVNEGDIVILEKNDLSDFRAIEDTKLVVVKFPSVPSDKYLVSEEE